jgi:hypothetical protein
MTNQWKYFKNEIQFIKKTGVATDFQNQLPVTCDKNENDVDGNPREKNFPFPQRHPVLILLLLQKNIWSLWHWSSFFTAFLSLVLPSTLKNSLDRAKIYGLTWQSFYSTAEKQWIVCWSSVRLNVKKLMHY